jgi:hypothetical protein
MRLFLSCLIFYSLCQTLPAQCSQCTVMIRGGMGLSTILIPRESNFENYSYASTVHFGVSYSSPITKKLRLESEVQWSQKGAKVKLDKDLINIDLSYASFPIAVNFVYHRWQIGLGLEPSFKLYTRIGGPFVTEPLRAIVSGAIPKKFEVNQFINFGYNWKKLQISNRIGLGLHNLSNNTSKTDQGPASKVNQLGRNIYYQFTLGYVFK